METLGVTALGVLATLVLSALGLRRKSESDYLRALERRADRLQRDNETLSTHIEQCDEEKELMRKANANQHKQIYDLLEENRAQAQIIRDLRRDEGKP